MSNPIKTAATELKVIAATAASAAVGVVIALLDVIVADPGLLGPVHPALEFVIVAAVPPLVTFLSGYAAPHTHRTDLVKARTTDPMSPR